MIIPPDGGVIEKVWKCCRNCGTLASPDGCKETSQVVGQTEKKKKQKSNTNVLVQDYCTDFLPALFF